MVDSRARARLGRIGAALVALVVVVPLARDAGSATVDAVVPTPPLGTVRAEVLPNGTPVLAVHGRDGQLDLIQAFTTEVEGPLTGLVGWCAPSQQLVDPHHGLLYDRRGRRVPVTLRGRLGGAGVGGVDALDDLIHRVVERVEGRTAEDDPVAVGGVQRLQPWQVARRPKLDPVVPPASCRVGAGAGGAGAGGADAGGADGAGAATPAVVSHAYLAGRVDPGREGWQVTTGWIRVGVDGVVAWCDSQPAADGACADPREDLAIGIAFGPGEVGGVPAVVGGPLAVRLAGGVVRRAAVLPSSTWEGSSLRGTEVVAAESAGMDAGSAALVVERGPGSPVALCEGRTAAPGSSAALPLASGAEVAGLPTGPAEVVVDRATCEVLAVRAG